MKLFKVREVMQILGVKKSRLQNYVVEGLIIPEQDSEGPGTDRLYSARNIAEISLAILLFKHGIRQNVIKHALDSLRESDGHLKQSGRAQILDPFSLSPKEKNIFVSIELADEGVEPTITLTVHEDDGKYFDLFDDKRPLAHRWGAIIVNLSKVKVSAGVSIADFIKGS